MSCRLIKYIAKHHLSIAAQHIYEGSPLYVAAESDDCGHRDVFNQSDTKRIYRLSSAEWRELEPLIRKH